MFLGLERAECINCQGTTSYSKIKIKIQLSTQLRSFKTYFVMTSKTCIHLKWQYNLADFITLFFVELLNFIAYANSTTCDIT